MARISSSLGLERPGLSFCLTDWLRSKKNFFSDVGADAPAIQATALRLASVPFCGTKLLDST